MAWLAPLPLPGPAVAPDGLQYKMGVLTKQLEQTRERLQQRKGPGRGPPAPARTAEEDQLFDVQGARVWPFGVSYLPSPLSKATGVSKPHPPHR